jgi:hypothetical protein
MCFIAAQVPGHGVGILADDTPNQMRPARTQQRPDGPAEEAHGADVGLVLEVAREGDDLLLR